MATKYEMHVYTMGTRAYAEEVCAAIDPGGKIFGNRILSRDESGSEYRSIFPRISHRLSRTMSYPTHDVHALCLRGSDSIGPIAWTDNGLW